MKTYDIKFDLTPCHKLDQFALLADQNYNYGNKGDWFGCFRGGLYGMYARLYGVQFHYKYIHSWESKITQMRQVESHLATIFFNMDSSLECFTYALNALGWIANPSQFLDVEYDTSLKKIKPSNIYGGTKVASIQGYANVFPNLQSHWVASKNLIVKIVEQHDVSKHRENICVGGKGRSDPPPGYEEVIVVECRTILDSPYLIMEEIILSKDPKTPSSKRDLTKSEDLDTLENLANEFSVFMDKSFKIAHNDAVKNIPLKYNEFQK